MAKLAFPKSTYLLMKNLFVRQNKYSVISVVNNFSLPNSEKYKNQKM